MILTSKGWLSLKYLFSRSSGYWVKEYVLTWGGLGLHEMETEKSRGRPAADLIVVDSNEPLKDKEDSQLNEGGNIESRLNSIGRPS